ncbi:MAG: hypothetical protein M0C28_06840 [Candidatus Moduliflexus flocculans]|nr:hypothetical protein [Candidatus Moduliflexus flocculans]
MAQRIRKIGGDRAVADRWFRSAAGAADLKSLTKELFAVPSTTGNEDMLAAKIRGAAAQGTRGRSGRPGHDRRPARRRGRADARPRRPRRLRPHGQRHHARGLSDPRPAGARRPTPGSTPSCSASRSSSRRPRARSAGVVSQPALHLLTPERRKTLVDGFSLETRLRRHRRPVGERRPGPRAWRSSTPSPTRPS